MKELALNPAGPEHLHAVQNFVEQEMEAAAFPPTAITQVAIAVEEIFTNIAAHAYHPGTGQATVRCAVSRGPLCVTVQFLDKGKPFNPLEHKLPDVAMPLEQREPGGLGILMARKLMTSLEYAREDGWNILTMRKCV